MMGLAQDVTHVQMKNDENMDKLYMGHLNLKLDVLISNSVHLQKR